MLHNEARAQLRSTLSYTQGRTSVQKLSNCRGTNSDARLLETVLPRTHAGTAPKLRRPLQRKSTLKYMYFLRARRFAWPDKHAQGKRPLHAQPRQRSAGAWDARAAAGALAGARWGAAPSNRYVPSVFACTVSVLRIRRYTNKIFACNRLIFFRDGNKKKGAS